MRLQVPVTFLLIVLCHEQMTCWAQLEPEVLIPGLGVVKGSLSTTKRFNSTVFNFRGIPYAQSPSGSLRFQAPKAALPWSGTLDCTLQRRACPQEPASNPNDTGDLEDCLHLNVFTKSLNATTGHPVIVFIHGGGYVEGSSEIQLPHRLLDRDLVLVVIQYRLGIPGFLSLHTDGVPGNAALLDVIESLRWVKDHVTVFGGDPTRVTVYGQSAGSLLASFLLTSPPAQGLFHGLILQSGNFLAPQYLEPDPVFHAKNIARLLGCDDDESLIEKCFMTATPKSMVTALNTYMAADISQGGDGKRGACPVIQKKGILALAEEPSVVLKELRTARVPVMLGTNIHEGVTYYTRVHEPYIVAKGLARNALFLKEDMTEYILKLGGLSDSGHLVVGPVQDKFLSTAQTGNIELMFNGIVDLFSQFWMKAPSHRLAQLQARLNVSIFYYSFHFPGEMSTSGVTDHAADIQYIFPERPEIPFTDLEEEISWRMVQLWANFATERNPTPAESPVQGVPIWPSYKPGVINNPYMIMDREFSIGYKLENEFDIAVRQGLNLSEFFPLP